MCPQNAGFITFPGQNRAKNGAGNRPPVFKVVLEGCTNKTPNRCSCGGNNVEVWRKGWKPERNRKAEAADGCLPEAGLLRGQRSGPARKAKPAACASNNRYAWALSPQENRSRKQMPLCACMCGACGLGRRRLCGQKNCREDGRIGDRSLLGDRYHSTVAGTDDRLSPEKFMPSPSR